MVQQTAASANTNQITSSNFASALPKFKYQSCAPFVLQSSSAVTSPTIAIQALEYNRWF